MQYDVCKNTKTGFTSIFTIDQVQCRYNDTWNRKVPVINPSTVLQIVKMNAFQTHKMRIQIFVRHSGKH